MYSICYNTLTHPSLHVACLSLSFLSSTADNSRRSASMVNVMPGRIGVDPNELRQKLKSVNTPTTTNEPVSAK